MVDAGHDLLDRRVARGEGGPDLRQPLGPVLDVVGERRARIGDHRAVARQQNAYRRRVGQRLHGVKGAKVVSQGTAGGDDGGAAPEHGVPGQQGSVLGKQQAEGIRGVARGADDTQLAAGRRDHVAVHQALAAQPVGRIGRPDRRIGEGGQPPCPRRMIAVPVRQQDLRDPAPGLRSPLHDPAEMLLVLGPGVHNQSRRGPGGGDQPGIGPLQGHRGWIGRKHTRRERGPGPVNGHRWLPDLRRCLLRARAAGPGG